MCLENLPRTLLETSEKEAHINPDELQKLVASTIQDRHTVWEMAAAVSNVRVKGRCGWYRLVF
jgi:hypothetical protein